jgi:hypothetical protein
MAKKASNEVKAIYFKIGKELHADIKVRAALEGKTIGDYILNAIVFYVKNTKGEK